VLQNGKKVRITKKGVLKIRGTTYTDRGTYVCTGMYRRNRRVETIRCYWFFFCLFFLFSNSRTTKHDVYLCTAGNAQATMNINIKPQPGEFPSSEEIDKPMNQQDPGEFSSVRGRRHALFPAARLSFGVDVNVFESREVQTTCRRLCTVFRRYRVTACK